MSQEESVTNSPPVALLVYATILFYLTFCGSSLWQASYLPALVFPFTLVFNTDELAALEVCMSVMMWWGHSWHATHPSPPVHILDALDTLLKYQEIKLYNHLKKLQVDTLKNSSRRTLNVFTLCLLMIIIFSIYLSFLYLKGVSRRGGLEHVKQLIYRGAQPHRLVEAHGLSVLSLRGHQPHIAGANCRDARPQDHTAHLRHCQPGTLIYLCAMFASSPSLDVFW